jgi:hypothetical protein
MYFRKTLISFTLLVSGGALARAAQVQVDCSKQSLANAVAAAHSGDNVSFTGVCAGPVVIQVNSLTLRGVGTAVIDGGDQDAVTVKGADQVVLAKFEVRNGLDGIIAVNGAHIWATNLHVHDNLVFGISLQTSSSAILTGVTIAANGVHGLDLETGSSATVTGAFSSSSNRVFGVNVNGSSITFSLATATMSGNALGMQVATAGNAFLNDSKTMLNFNYNLATGLTVVSGAHMVSFGGTINSTGNGLNGVSINSKAGLDLDAATQLNVSGNAEGLVLQEGSVMTVFNIPQFSGVQGFSTIHAHDNTVNGVRVQQNSTLTFANNAKLITSSNNIGLLADNGAAVTLVNSTLTGNTTKDLELTFGTRADIQTTTLGTYTCDATVLARGTAPVTCPH